MPGRRLRTVTSDDIRGEDFSHSRILSLSENGGKCEYCQRAPASHGDHFIPANYFAGEVNARTMTLPEARAEANHISNIVGACGVCNLGKYDKIPTLTPGTGGWNPPNPTDRIKRMLRLLEKGEFGW
jgi:5-methylcytosine-specific restriction endonuclease McrA